MTTILSTVAAPDAGDLRRALDEAGFAQGADPYRVVFVVDPGDEAARALGPRAEGRQRTLVIAAHGAGREPDPWQLLSAGADDVLAWSGAATVDAVVERVRRWRVVDEILDSPVVTGRLVGRSAALRAALRDLVELAVFSTGPILLVGETGTGKEAASRLVGELADRDGRGRFVVVDCTTIVPTLSGSELFGHERGAFTGADRARSGAFAEADGGTLFLDEIGDLPLSLQSELLRVIQERTYKRVGGNVWVHTDFRLVTATNRDLAKAQRKGRFRSDLYHRIAAGVVRLPPLRERPEDLEDLFCHFLTEARGAPAPPLDPAVVALLRGRAFPGNLRELKQLATRVAARHVGSGTVTPGAVPEADRPAADRARRGGPGASVGRLAAAVRDCLGEGLGLQDLKGLVGDLAVAAALEDCGGNAQLAANRLGVTDRAVQLRRRGLLAR